MQELYELGSCPPLGEVPRLMYAQTIREERFGLPRDAFQVEAVPVPEIGPGECLVLVMAAGINYNNVWAALGRPLNCVQLHRREGDHSNFHIGGSDASGIVYRVGEGVQNVKVGDEVVIHCAQWDENDPAILDGVDPIVAPSNRIWGYEANYGSFAQFTRVQSHQLLPKPRHLSWEEAAAYMLVGATAWRMLFGWTEHRLRKDDVVLIWGGAGGLGSMAIQLAKEAGAIPVAVVSSEDKAEFCRALGARGVINRRLFSHWGRPPALDDQVGYDRWLKSARAFGKAIWDAIGVRRNPRIVFEHPGQDTIPTSLYVCDRGGMVVICAGTTGYEAVVDLRYHWMQQKRLQGSHFANDEQCAALNQLVCDQKLDPCLSRTFAFEEIGLAHQLMHDNQHPNGNMAALVSAPTTGLGIRT